MKMQTLAHEKLTGLPVEVHWMGNVPNNEIIHFYQNEKIDLFVNVSDSEGIPVSIMEALSAGIPCFATDVGGNGEAVVNGENGFLVPVNESVNQLSKVICSDKHILAEMGKKAKSYWDIHFNASNNYPAFVASALFFGKRVKTEKNTVVPLCLKHQLRL